MEVHGSSWKIVSSTLFLNALFHNSFNPANKQINASLKLEGPESPLREGPCVRGCRNIYLSSFILLFILLFMQAFRIHGLGLFYVWTAFKGDHHGNRLIFSPKEQTPRAEKSRDNTPHTTPRTQHPSKNP